MLCVDVFIAEAREMAQWLETLTTFAEDLGSVFCTHMEAHNHP